MRVLHVAPTAFGHDGLFGGGERYPLELARALALVDGVRCELVTFGREARVEEHDGLRIHVLRAVGHLGGHSAHPVAPVTPGDELVLMWVEREHRLAVGLPDTGIAVSERVGERPVERLDAIVERHPRIDLAAVREQFPPAADSREVRGDKQPHPAPARAARRRRLGPDAGLRTRQRRRTKASSPDYGRW
jgi:hypothetical protein